MLVIVGAILLGAAGAGSKSPLGATRQGDSAQYELCMKLAEQAVYTVLDQSVDRDLSADFMTYFSMSKEEAQHRVDTRDSSGGFNVPLGEMLLGAEYGNGVYHQHAEALRKSVQSGARSSFEFAEVRRVLLNTASTEILSAIVALCPPPDTEPRYGTSLSVVNGNEDEPTVILGYRKGPGMAESVRVVRVVAQNLELLHPSVLTAGETLVSDFESVPQVVRRRDPFKRATLAVALEGFGLETLVLEPVEEESPVVLGSVTVSVLPWAQFAPAAGISSSFKAKESKWAPCDGRDIRGSRLSSNGVQLAPDLRGVFLRGLNSFASDEPRPVASRQRDPMDGATDDPNGRVAGDFQEDGIQSHSVSGHVSVAISGSPGSSGGLDGGGNRFVNSGRTGLSASYSGVAETRPVNVAVYYYIRIN